LQGSEIKTDITKLKSQYTETKLKHNKEIGIGIMIIDTAPKENERMKKIHLMKLKNLQKKTVLIFGIDHKISFFDGRHIE